MFGALEEGPWKGRQIHKILWKEDFRGRSSGILEKKSLERSGKLHWKAGEKSTGRSEKIWVGAGHRKIHEKVRRISIGRLGKYP